MKYYYRRRDLEKKLGLSRSTIYRMMEAGSFPRPVQIGARAVGWCSKEIENWIDNRYRSKAARQARKTKVLIPQKQAKDWMFHPPHGKWFKSIVNWIDDQTTYGRSRDYILSKIGDCPPEGGWNDDYRAFVSSVLKIALKENENAD